MAYIFHISLDKHFVQALRESECRVIKYSGLCMRSHLSFFWWFFVRFLGDIFRGFFRRFFYYHFSLCFVLLEHGSCLVSCLDNKLSTKNTFTNHPKPGDDSNENATGVPRIPAIIYT